MKKDVVLVFIDSEALDFIDPNFIKWVQKSLLPTIDPSLDIFRCQFVGVSSRSGGELPALCSENVYVICPYLVLSDEAIEILEVILPGMTGTSRTVVTIVYALDVCTVGVEFNRVKTLCIPGHLTQRLNTDSRLGIVAEYCVIPQLTGVKNITAFISTYLKGLGKKPYLYALGPISDMIVQDIPSLYNAASGQISSDSVSVVLVDRSMDMVASCGHHDNFWDFLNRYSSKRFSSEILAKAFEDLPSLHADAFSCSYHQYHDVKNIVSGMKDGLNLIRKKLIDVIQNDAGITGVKVPKILGKVSINQLVKLLDWGIANESYLKYWEDGVREALIAIDALTQSEASYQEELIGIERVILASLSEKDSSMDILMEQILKLIPKASNRNESKFSLKQLLDLVMYLHGLSGKRLDPFIEDLKEAFVDGSSCDAEKDQVRKFFDNLLQASEYRIKFNTFKYLYDQSSASYVPLIVQIIKALSNQKTDLSDMTFVAAGDPNIAKYLNKILKTSAKMHPLNQSDRVVIVMIGGITGFELGCAFKAIEEVNGLADRISFLSLPS